MLLLQVGSGVQTLLVATVTLLLATLGFLSPASRGALLTTAIVLFVLLSFAAGAAAVALWGVMERTYEGWVGVALQVRSLVKPYLGVRMSVTSCRCAASVRHTVCQQQCCLPCVTVLL